MKEILSEIDRWQGQGETVALATLVRVRGSAPRRSGARLALTPTGKMKGSVSGGCVENDVFERALGVIKTGKPALARYQVTNEAGFEIGLSCGGSIDVLIEPFVRDEVLRRLHQALETQKPAALCIALSPDALLGRRMLVLDGETVGAIDPAIDAELARAAREHFEIVGTYHTTLPSLAENKVSDGQVFEDKANSEATFFIESFAPPLSLWIVGGTHTAIPLCRMAREVGFEVTIVDPRPSYASKERFPDATAIVEAWPEEALARAPLDDYTYVVTLTHDAKFDLPTLRQVLRSNVRYIGALGSRKTHAARKEKLLAEGFNETEIARIHAPIGLDLGARTAEEIALSILAELVAVRHGRDGGALCQRGTAIYGDR